MRALTLAVLLGLWCQPGAGPRAAEDVSVETMRRGTAVEVLCRATLSAPRELIWQTLTDYNRLSEFIPGMLKSRVLEVRGPVSVVEQLGEVRFLLFTFPIEVTVASTDRPPDVLEVQLLKGNLRRLEGGYRIEALDGGRVILHWQGLIEPESPMPPLIGELLMRTTIADQFQGMVREIERRDLQRREREGRR
jgi:ribosome-associated toxin RatA of RatAB toxin-antitoxin module